jgi:hypothetical protein
VTILRTIVESRRFISVGLYMLRTYLIPLVVRYADSGVEVGPIRLGA